MLKIFLNKIITEDFNSFPDNPKDIEHPDEGTSFVLSLLLKTSAIKMFIKTKKFSPLAVDISAKSSKKIKIYRDNFFQNHETFSDILSELKADKNILSVIDKWDDYNPSITVKSTLGNVTLVAGNGTRNKLNPGMANEKAVALQFEQDLAADFELFQRGEFDSIAREKHKEIISQVSSRLKLKPKDILKVIHAGTTDTRRGSSFDGTAFTFLNNSPARIADVILDTTKGMKYLSLKYSETKNLPFRLANAGVANIFNNVTDINNFMKYLGLNPKGLKNIYDKSTVAQLEDIKEKPAKTKKTLLHLTKIGYGDPTYYIIAKSAAGIEHLQFKTIDQDFLDSIKNIKINGAPTYPREAKLGGGVTGKALTVSYTFEAGGTTQNAILSIYNTQGGEIPLTMQIVLK